MGVLQQSLEEAIAQLPAIVLENLLAEKLKERGIGPTRSLPRKLARHILDGNNGSYTHRSRKLSGNVDITVTEADGQQLMKALRHLHGEYIPVMVPRMARRIGKRTLKDLKSKWQAEETMQDEELTGFRERLEGRWNKPLGQLRMLLTMVREWCGDIFHREEARRPHKKKQLREILVRLLVRAIQVTDEIVCLLENGFADGAMARWRTLHEIAVVAAVIAEHGESIAVRYIAHQAVESQRALNKYLACCPLLGYRPLPTRDVKKINKAYAAAIAKYGPEFKSDYGWAAHHLKKSKPTFADLEAAAGRAKMRSHYQMGNDNVHAGVKSMFVRLGLVGEYNSLLSGRSNGGLTEPGQNAAHTLAQLAVIVCLSEPTFDDLVVASMIRDLQDQIPGYFFQVEKQLQKDHKKFRAQAREQTVKDS